MLGASLTACTEAAEEGQPVLFALRRVGAILPILLLVTVVAFLLLHLTPGDPARTLAGADATAEQLEAVRESYGLNDRLVVQYQRWVTGIFQGDLGRSYITGEPVFSPIVRRLPATLSLTFGAVVIAVLISAPAGIVAALRRGRFADRMIVSATSAGIALPDFFIGLLLILVFALRLGWLPATGYVPIAESPVLWFQYLLLPSIALGVAVTAELTRQIRAGLTDTLAKDYVRTARAKGLSTSSVVVRHALKNASIPVVTVLGLQIRRLLGGTIIIEQVFSIPGIGSLVVDSIFRRDIPVILGVVVVSAFIVLLVNLIVDLSYGFFDPRVRE